MITKYYVDSAGTFLGAFVGVEPPAGAIEVSDLPSRGTDIWDGEQFQAAPVQVPEVITCGQGREALYNAGLFGKVQPAIDAIEDADTKWRVQNAWDYRPTWGRESPFVAMMAAILGLNNKQTDELFIDAAQL
jgi:hypothetical protein